MVVVRAQQPQGEPPNTLVESLLVLTCLIAVIQNVKLPVNVPMPAEPGQTPPAPPKTLPHALSRAAKAGALNVGLEDRLGKTLNTYAEAMEKVSRACPCFGNLGERQGSSLVMMFIHCSTMKGRRRSSSARPRHCRQVLDSLAGHSVVFDCARHEGQGQRQDCQVGAGFRSICVSCPPFPA